MVSHNFRQAYLQEVGLTQISGDYDFCNIFFSMTNFNTYSGWILAHILGQTNSLDLVDFETY